MFVFKSVEREAKREVRFVGLQKGRCSCGLTDISLSRCVPLYLSVDDEPVEVISVRLLDRTDIPRTGGVQRAGERAGRAQPRG